jgi:hypothetical protein
MKTILEFAARIRQVAQELNAESHELKSRGQRQMVRQTILRLQKQATHLETQHKRQKATNPKARALSVEQQWAEFFARQRNEDETNSIR